MTVSTSKKITLFSQNQTMKTMAARYKELPAKDRQRYEYLAEQYRDDYNKKKKEFL